MREAIVLVHSVLLVMAASCNREQDRSAAAPPAGALVEGNQVTPLQPGTPVPVRPVLNPLAPTEEVLAEGKWLFDHFNCSGCHASGGGAIGPPLMDDEWIYGSSAGNIFWTIIEGRPQGMPAYGGRIAERQVWQLVAYVRSLSGLDKKGEQAQQAAAGTR
jgi:cytochrome c oxidase cbb3-type subunit 3